jgi:hypothetical protein
MMTPRTARFALAVIALSGWTAPPGQAQAPPDPYAIVDVNVVDVRAGVVLPAQTVVLADGQIQTVAPGADVPGAAEVLDGAGMYLIPGLWDMHAHVRHPLAPSLVLPQFVAHGVTGVRDMNSECENPDEGVCIGDLRDWQRQIEADSLVGPRLLALSSFPLNPPWDYEVTEEQARGIVQELHRRGVDLVKTYYRLSPEAFGWVVDEANRLGIAAGGHLPLQMTAADASEAGVRSVEHARDFLFDCFPGSATFRAGARSQDPPVDVMRAMVDEHDEAACAEAFETFVRNDTWYVPTHVTRRMDAFADDSTFRNDPRARYIWSEVWDQWQADADRMVALDPSPEGRRVMRGFYETGLEITGRAHAAGVHVVLGTDAGDTYVFFGSGVHDELGELVKAGLSPADALAAATVRSAEFLGLEAEYGTVEAGRRADLVLLRRNPLEAIEHTREIEAVFFGGRYLRRADLDAMLSDVEAAVAAQGGGGREP